MKTEIIQPFILRGLLILLMNPLYYDPDNQEPISAVIKSIEILLSTTDDASLYLERFLIQLSTDEFLKIV
jgi:hypothetical protein